MVYAFASADPGQREELASVYGHENVTNDDVERILRLLDELGAQGYCAGVAEEHKDAALREIGAGGLRGDSADALRETAAFLLERDY